MSKKVHVMSMAGLLLVALAASVAVTQLYGEQLQTIGGDFRNAAVAEVHDAQGQVLLRGSFAPVETDDEGEIERLAPLTAVASQVTAKGEAEVEYQRDAPTEQEVELSLSGLGAGTEIAFVIDGTKIATAKADQRGRVSIELSVKQ
ncbi:MAG TPA: hypothetical protein VFV51_18645 [Vicinamibacterales bacterium]|nr:hypothetical protein [Vicinamibacterales bacterium]